MQQLFFFIGTEAEFIKLFPVMIELEKRNIDYRIVSSGQNDIQKSALFSALKHNGCDLVLSDTSKMEKNAGSLLCWFLKTARLSKRVVTDWMKKSGASGAMLIVHGDTVSTLMGAWLGWKLRLMPVHIEAGLRSFDYLNPFPEEISRVLVSRFARLHFAPGAEACGNIRKKNDRIVDTRGNTLIDALAISRNFQSDAARSNVPEGRYFVFVVHRQENIAKKAILERFIEEMILAAEKVPCVYILHEPTKAALVRFDLLKKIEACDTVHIVGRMEYFPFMQLLDRAIYVVTDGGSNQEELSYMGKPCLLLRQKTERKDGLGENAILFDGEPARISWFSEHYTDFIRPAVPAMGSPSEIIVDTLLELQHE
jgi:UDP-N-acetylglucosamine 2-epimerase (non-hydrolysing)